MGYLFYCLAWFYGLYHKLNFLYRIITGPAAFFVRLCFGGVQYSWTLFVYATVVELDCG